MKLWTLTTFSAVALVCAPALRAQRSQETPSAPPPPEPARAQPVDPPTTSTVMRTNSMNVLDDKKRLGANDFVSFRVVEDRDDESQRLRVNDNGELEVPYVGDRKSTRLNSSHANISYAVFCLKKK